MLIYKVTNNKNGCVYIGQTTLSLKERRYKHEQESLNAYRKTVKFHNALLKHGFENFTWEVIKECNSQEELDYFEKYYIQYYNACDKNKGYNLKYGGRTGGLFTEEAKANLGKSTKKKWKNPECAAKMLAGLRKGTETVKEQAKNNFILHTCPVCGKTFKTKNWNSHIYCTPKCVAIANKDKLLENSRKAALVNHSRYEEARKEKLEIIREWAIEHKDALSSVKFNNLTLLDELMPLVSVKDYRSLAKILKVTSKRDTVRELINIIKCTPTIQETV